MLVTRLLFELCAWVVWSHRHWFACLACWAFELLLVLFDRLWILIVMLL